MHFTKMHGLGNDYLYYYGELEQPKEMSIKLSDCIISSLLWIKKRMYILSK